MTDYTPTAQLSVPVGISTEICVSSQSKMEANLNKKKKNDFCFQFWKEFWKGY